MKFHILGSSSAGNCSFLQTSEGNFLIDAGLSGKKIAQGLEKLGEHVETIDAVFITHEHEDHVRGLAGLSRYCPGLTFVSNEKTARAVQSRFRRNVEAFLFETGRAFTFKGMYVHAMPLPHDALDPVGYLFDIQENERNQKLAWVTDLGGIPHWLPEIIQKVDTLVLEANYEEKLLMEDHRRPWSVKQRIRGPRGHLSNVIALDLLTSLAPSSHWQQVYLAHLSKHCNDPSLIESQLEAAGLLTQSFTTHIVPPE